MQAARAAQPGWAAATAYNRGQVLYRARRDGRGARRRVRRALQRPRRGRALDRSHRLVRRLGRQAAAGARRLEPRRRARTSTSRSPSRPASSRCSRPTSRRCSASSRACMPPLVGGNAVVAVASETRPLAAIELAEAIATSDVPGGVVNILTGYRDDMAPTLASHMDVNAIDLCGADGLVDRARGARRREREAHRPRPRRRAEPVGDRELPRAEDGLAPDRPSDRCRNRRSPVGRRPTGVPLALLAGAQPLGRPPARRGRARCSAERGFRVALDRGARRRRDAARSRTRTRTGRPGSPQLVLDGRGQRSASSASRSWARRGAPRSACTSRAAHPERLDGARPARRGPHRHRASSSRARSSCAELEADQADVRLRELGRLLRRTRASASAAWRPALEPRYRAGMHRASTGGSCRARSARAAAWAYCTASRPSRRARPTRRLHDPGVAPARPSRERPAKPVTRFAGRRARTPRSDVVDSGHDIARGRPGRDGRRLVADRLARLGPGHGGTQLQPRDRRGRRDLRHRRGRGRRTPPEPPRRSAPRRSSSRATRRAVREATSLPILWRADVPLDARRRRRRRVPARLRRARRRRRPARGAAPARARARARLRRRGARRGGARAGARPRRPGDLPALARRGRATTRRRSRSCSTCSPPFRPASSRSPTCR